MKCELVQTLVVDTERILISEFIGLPTLFLMSSSQITFGGDVTKIGTYL